VHPPTERLHVSRPVDTAVVVLSDEAEDKPFALFLTAEQMISSERKKQVMHTRFLFLSLGFWQKQPLGGAPRGLLRSCTTSR